MVKLFISQPMNGRVEADILKERNEVISIVKQMINDDVEVIESYFEDYKPLNGCVPLKYLAKSLKVLADADLACFVGDWRNYRGCRIENICAKEYGIDTMVYEPNK